MFSTFSNMSESFQLTVAYVITIEELLACHNFNLLLGVGGGGDPARKKTNLWWKKEYTEIVLIIPFNMCLLLE